MKNHDPLEKDIEKRVCDYAKSLKMLVYKFTSPSRRSVPDRMFIKNKTVFFAEFKRKGKKPTASQEVEIQKLQNQGIEVFVIDEIETGKLWIRNMDHKITDREANDDALIRKLVGTEHNLDIY